MSTTAAEAPRRTDPQNPASVELAPGIWSTPGVCGGWACVGRTRITVSGLVEWRQLGLSDTKILEALPSLTPQGLSNAWEYARQHPEEIQREIDENNED